MTPEWSREQAGRWDAETRVLVDAFLERGAIGVLSDDEVAEVLRVAADVCAPFGRSQWLGIATPDDTRVQDDDGLSERHADCPLAWLHRFDFTQLETPRPLLSWETPRRPLGRITAIDHATGVITVSAEYEWTDARGRRRSRPVDEVFEIRDGNRTLVYQRVRLTQEQIEASQAAGGGAVLTMGAAQWQQVAERPYPAPVVHETQRSRVPGHVARHRRRLDGRRT